MRWLELVFRLNCHLWTHGWKTRKQQLQEKTLTPKYTQLAGSIYGAKLYTQRKCATHPQMKGSDPPTPNPTPTPPHPHPNQTPTPNAYGFPHWTAILVKGVEFFTFFVNFESQGHSTSKWSLHLKSKNKHYHNIMIYYHICLKETMSIERM